MDEFARLSIEAFTSAIEDIKETIKAIVKRNK